MESKQNALITLLFAGWIEQITGKGSLLMGAWLGRWHAYYKQAQLMKTGGSTNRQKLNRVRFTFANSALAADAISTAVIIQVE